MPRPAGAMDTSSVWEGQEAKTWTELTEKVFGKVCDQHNADQNKYDKPLIPKVAEPETSIPLPGKEVVIPVETSNVNIEKLTKSMLERDEDPKFTPELKQEFLEIVIENKFKILEVCDEFIKFEYNNKEFMIVPYE